MPLELSQVSHWFGDVVAVNDISFVVTPGITGLLGPNGAGKSTVLQLAAGLLKPSSGVVSVFGVSPAGRHDVFSRVALVPEREALPGMMTARAFVSARAAMLGLTDVEGATQRALSVVEMEKEAHRRLSEFSKGMRQRIKLAAALVHEPTLLLLDEPFNGLDPRQRRGMTKLLESLAEKGASVLLSSHILEEMQGVASRILVMLAGRLAASGDFRALRRMMTDQPHTVHVKSSDDRQLAAMLLAIPVIVGIDISVHLTGLTIRTSDYATLARGLPRIAHDHNITLYEVDPIDQSLEHVFAYLMTR